MQEHLVRKYFLVALFFIGAIFSILVLRPFVVVLILSLALSATIFPLYSRLKKYLKVPWVASLFTVIIFVILLCVPVFIVGTIVFKQAQSLSGWIADNGGIGTITNTFNYSINHLFPQGLVNIDASFSSMATKLTAGIGNAFTATLSTLFTFLLVILSMFYFLKDGSKWRKTLVQLSPLSDDSDNKIIEKLRVTVNGVVRGYLLIGIIQGILLGIGLWIFGVPNAALWGVIAGIASFVPMIGTAFVSVPAVIFLVVSGHTGAAIGLGVWSAVLVGTIDNMLTPILVGRKIEIHPLIVLFAVLGGIAFVGPIGILIGPLTISFMYALVSIYKTETV